MTETTVNLTKSEAVGKLVDLAQEVEIVDPIDWGMLNIKESSWDLASQPLLKFNHQINNAELLFRMIEDEEISVQTNKIKFK